MDRADEEGKREKRLRWIEAIIERSIEALSESESHSAILAISKKYGKSPSDSVCLREKQFEPALLVSTCQTLAARRLFIGRWRWRMTVMKETDRQTFFCFCSVSF
mmetsp:Transcript_23794/g.46747  ORF Transcript_23794/g.46747 Transcript_23794/m.46747 type:complete len:105 (-) Transcript_23794:747-1061(-)